MKDSLDLGINHAKSREASSNIFWDMPISIFRKFYYIKAQKHLVFVWEALCGEEELTTRLGRRALQFTLCFSGDQLCNFTVT